MKKLIFISVLVVIIGTYFTVSAFSEFYVIPVKKCGIKVTSNIVPKTGQTNCYYDNGVLIGTCTCGGAICSAGQDGDLKKGYVHAIAAPSAESPYTVPNWTGDRFTDNNNGTITDNLTSLIWLKDANSLSGITVWASALNYCNNLASGGDLTDGSSAGDWRLPNINELRSLVDPTESYLALPDGHPFTGVQTSQYYWSSTTCAFNYIYAWAVYMNDGSVHDDGKGYSNCVWPVRSDN